MYQKLHLRLNLRLHFKIELRFKLHMLMHLLLYKSSKNNSLKGELKGSLNVAFKSAPKIFFQGTLKVWKKCEEIDTFEVVIDGLLDSAIESVLEAPRDAINSLYKDAQETTVTFKQNFVNMLIFQLLLFMFNLSKMQVINRDSAGWRRGVKTTVYSTSTRSRGGHVTISTTFKEIE